jgi:hypothetical protein
VVDAQSVAVTAQPHFPGWLRRRPDGVHCHAHGRYSGCLPPTQRQPFLVSWKTRGVPPSHVLVSTRELLSNVAVHIEPVFPGKVPVHVVPCRCRSYPMFWVA